MSSKDIEQAIAKLNFTTNAETDQRILDDAYATLSKGAEGQRPRGIWQIVLHNRLAVPTAIAATILLAFALFVSLQSPKTAKIEGIYAALSKVDNIHISEFKTGRMNPDQQMWASKTLGMKLFKTEISNQAQYTLWDTKNRVKMIKLLSSNMVQTEPITQQMLTELEKSEAGLARMISLSDKNNIPEDIQWSQMNNREVSADVPGTRVYELNRIEKGTIPGTTIYRKWHIYAEERTNLPKRIEWYSKSGSEDEYVFDKFVIIAYPTENEIQNIIRKIFDRKDDPEFIGTPEAYR